MGMIGQDSDNRETLCVCSLKQILLVINIHYGGSLPSLLSLNQLN